MKPTATTQKSTTIDYLLLPRLRGLPPLPPPNTTTTETPTTPTTVEDILETTSTDPITSTMITDAEDYAEIDSFKETEEHQIMSVPTTSHSTSTVPSPRTTTKTTTSTIKKLSPSINLKGNYFYRYYSSYQRPRQTRYSNPFSMRFSGNRWLWFRNWRTVHLLPHIILYQTWSINPKCVLKYSYSFPSLP